MSFVKKLRRRLSGKNNWTPCDHIPNAKSKRATSECWQKKVVDLTIVPMELVHYAAIISFPAGEIKYSNFEISPEVIKGIIKALQGDTSAIQQGIKLNEELPLYIPGKMEKGKAIYGTSIPPAENKQDESAEKTAGSLTVFKTKSNILVSVSSNPDVQAAMEFSRSVAKGMKDKGH